MGRDDGPPLEFEVFDAQAQTLHQAYAAAIDQLGHQLVHARQAADEAQRLFLRQDGGQPFRALGAQGVKGTEFLVKHFAVEKKQSAEGLILGGGGDVFLPDLTTKRSWLYTVGIVGSVS